MLQQHGRPVAPHVHSQQMTRIQNAASKQKAMMDQTAAASEAAARQAALQNYPQLAEQYRARALEAHRRSQLIALQVEEAKKIADAAAQVSRDQDLVLRAALQAAPEQAQRVDAAEEGDIGQLLLMIQQDAAAAGVTEEQYFTMFLPEQQDVAGGGLQQHHGQMHHYVGMGITGNQNTAMNLTTAGLQHHGYLGLEQYQQTQQQHQQHAMHGSGFGATNMTFQTEGPSNADALLLQQQLQSQPQALNVQFQGEQSPSSWLVPLPPQLLPESARQQEKDVVTHGQLQMQMTEGQQAAVVVAHKSPAAEERGQKRGRLDAQAVVNAQREDVMMYGAAAAKKIWDDKLQKITAGFAAAAAGISTNSEDMAQQQVQEEQHKNGEATGAACAASLPPGQQLADVPHQQPNDGGDEGESSDLAACFSVPYPDPLDDRR